MSQYWHAHCKDAAEDSECVSYGKDHLIKLAGVMAHIAILKGAFDVSLTIYDEYGLGQAAEFMYEHREHALEAVCEYSSVESVPLVLET